MYFKYITFLLGQCRLIYEQMILMNRFFLVKQKHKLLKSMSNWFKARLKINSYFA